MIGKSLDELKKDRDRQLAEAFGFAKSAAKPIDKPVTESPYRIKYGFYSPSAADEYGTIVWETPEGKEVFITATSSTPSGDDYNWEDKRLVGPVVRYIRGNK